MKVGDYEIRLTYERMGQIVVLQSEVAVPLLFQSLSESRFSKLEIHKRHFVLRPRYLFWFLWYWRFSSRLVANLCAHIRSHRFRVAVGMDFLNIPINAENPPRYLLDECALRLRQVEFFTVQHGWQWNTRPPARPIRNMTLLTFGSQSASHFADFGRRECNQIPIGSLSLSNYLSTRPAEKIVKYDICLVSSIRNEKFFRNPDERAGAFVAMVELFEHYTQRTTNKVVVALNNRAEEADSQSEKNWFAGRLGIEVDFTDPSRNFGGLIESPDSSDGSGIAYSTYATYLASDLAKVTIGGTSTVLWESFARGNKILAVNMTNHANYDLPEIGSWSLRKPSRQEFEDRLNEILDMDPERWTSLTATARERLIMSDSDVTSAMRLGAVVARAVRAI